MKQTKHLLTTIAVLLCCVVTNAEIRDSGTCGDNLNWFLTTDGELVIQGTGRMADYNREEQAPWIKHDFLIEKVSIKEGVTYIGEYAFIFENIYGPTLMNIPNSVTEIGVCAFSGCKGELILDCNMAIPEGVFVGSRFTNISIGDGVTSIGDYAFDNCSSLTSITIPESVTSIGDCAFEYCSRLTSITIPGSVASIGCGAFMNCSRLTSITILEGVTLIDQQAFSGCNSLTFITFPKSATETFAPFDGCCTDSIVVYGYIPRGVFGGGGFAKVIIDNSVTSIGDYAFECCSSLTSITIPESVTSIGDGAFTECSSLTSIVIPKSVTSIGEAAFTNCSSITSITIPESVTSIGDDAFYNCSSLTSITIPESVTSIEYGTFRKCSSLTSIAIPKSVTSIGDCAFEYCSSLTSISIPESVTSIEAWAFKGCSSLTSITIPESVTSIGSYAFEGCSSLTSITIPESVTSIGSYAFEGCTGELIVNCNIPSSAFCRSNFTKAVIGDKVASIGKNAFDDCDDLISIAFPKSVVYIAENALDGTAWYDMQPEGVIYASYVLYKYKGSVPENTSLEIKEETVSISPHAFYNCSNLISISIPESVTSIGDYAFTGCSQIESITCKAITPPSCSRAFAGAYMIEAVNKTIPVYVPDASVSIYKETDGWKEFTNIMPLSSKNDKYVLTYLVDGAVYRTDSLDYNTPIVLADEPTKEGYTFSGWSEVPDTMPMNDLTVSGTFAINKYLVTFKIGDEVIAADSLEYGVAIVAPEVPEKEGHTFAGWGDVAETVPAHDVIYEGIYTVNTYNVYYYVGEELVHTAEVAYGEAIPEYIYEPTEEGYTFLGWIGDTYETMPAHDVTYTANIDDAIDNLMIDNGQLTIYDLQGRKVLNTENLKGGVYIINGKRVLIK